MLLTNYTQELSSGSNFSKDIPQLHMLLTNYTQELSSGSNFSKKYTLTSHVTNKLDTKAQGPISQRITDVRLNFSLY